ncbi:MAG: radical SAM protein [Candidatus Riflebacteria bacterium]|nr:radical SAM protein [Candidatus Riflebacteria bacterium]
MRLLLLSGLGPYFLESHLLDGTLLASPVDPEVVADYRAMAGHDVDLARFSFQGRPLLRSYQGSMPHLGTETLRSILDRAGIEHELFDLSHVWRKDREPEGSFDVVALSTSFLCDAKSLGAVLKWIDRRHPEATLVLGGQYSNLKYRSLMERHRQIDFILRGDGESAFPRLMQALAGRLEMAFVPNLVFRGDDGQARAGDLDHVDLEAQPSPSFCGTPTIIPYESMRGCPFACRFCSYPSASPRWRYRSAGRIVDDWKAYLRNDPTVLIRAQDSTFTAPPDRLRLLLDLLPEVGVRWEAYSRADVIDGPATVARLEAALCQALQIGLESMCDATLRLMNKRVTVAQNTRAVELLGRSSIDLRAYYIVGFPGETPEAWEETHTYLVERHEGHFGLHVFAAVDETMPVWQDAPALGFEATGALDWKHSGMDSATARELARRALRETRWKNDAAVLRQWQLDYQSPLVPELDRRANLRLEKLLEKLAFLRKDRGRDSDLCRKLLHEVSLMGIDVRERPA